MESKFVIFVALATLTQSSFALPPRAYELSEEQSAELDQIIKNQEAVVLKNSASLNPIFDALQKLWAIRSQDLEANTDDNSKVAEAHLKVKEAIDHLLYSIPRAVGTTCAHVETARNATNAYMNLIYSVIPTAIGLARSGTYTENRAVIEVLKSTGRLYVENYVKSIYHSLRACVNSNDADAAIQTSENGSVKSLNNTFNAIFNGIELVAGGISADDEDLNIPSEIEVQRDLALAGVRDDVEHNFSVLKAVYINSQLGQKVPLSSLRTNQYTLTASNYRYKDGVKPIFNTVRGYLTGVVIGLSGTCNDDGSPMNNARAATANAFKSALRTRADAIVATTSEASAAAVAALEYLDNFLDRITNDFYSSINLARGREANYTEAVRKIEAIKAELNAIYPTFIQTTYSIIQNGRSSGNDVVAKIEALKDIGYGLAITFVDHIFNATDVLARASYGINDVSEDDFAAIQTELDGIFSDIDEFTYDISLADLLLLQVESADQARINAANSANSANSVNSVNSANAANVANSYLPPSNLWNYGNYGNVGFMPGTGNGLNLG